MEEDHRDELLPAGDVVLNVGSVLREEEVLESNDDEVQGVLSGLESNDDEVQDALSELAWE